MPFVRAACISILIVAACPSGARAQPAHLADADTEVAQRHFRIGSEAYAAGRYTQAIAEFTQAEELRPLPALEFNIGRCHDRLGNWRLAAEAYQRYLDRAPDAEDADEVRTRIAILKQRLRERAPAVANPVESEPFPNRPALAPRSVEPRTNGVRAAAWAVGGVALALGITGAVLVGTVAPDFDDLQSACRIRRCSSSDWSALEARANAGYALLGLAGAAAIADVILWSVDGRRRGARAWLAPAPGGLALAGAY
jgi:tetratricopeptide (TPR) repeat protein